MKYVLFFMILVMGAGTQSQAQNTDVMQELLRLRSLMNRSPYLNFNLAYYYEEDTSSGGIIRDTLIGESNVFNGRSYTRLNGMKRVNNEFYNATVDTVNQEIFVTNPEPMTRQYLSADFSEPDFFNYYISGTTMTDSGTYRIINISFTEAAPFNWYKLVYNISSSQPAYLQYSMKKGDELSGSVAPGPPPPGGGGGGGGRPSIRLKVVFSNFNTNTNNPQLFNTDTWFTRQNGLLVLTPAFSNYTITDLTN
jgi:hypothetical protein